MQVAIVVALFPVVRWLPRGGAVGRLLLAPVFATVAWGTRDQWLAAWGLQSPGRWLA